MEDLENITILRYKRRIYKFFNAYKKKRFNKKEVIFEIEKTVKEYYNEEVTAFAREVLLRINRDG